MKYDSGKQTNATASMTFPSATYADIIVATFKAASSGSGSPAASLSPTSLIFASQGSQTVATTSPAQAVTLANSGSASLSINSIANTGTNSDDFALTINCGSSERPFGCFSLDCTSPSTERSGQGGVSEHSVPVFRNLVPQNPSRPHY